MKKRLILGVGAISVGFLTAASLAFATGALDGKTFTGTIGKKGETTGQTDDFVFKDGKFESTLCEQFGYGTGDYKTAMVGDATQFSAQTTNAKGGQMNWTGKVTQGRLVGTVASTENGKTSEMWFNGTIKKN